MAQRISAGSAAAFDVRVTGRRVLAIIADGLVLGVVFSAISVLGRMVGLGEADAPLFAGYTWAGGFFSWPWPTTPSWRATAGRRWARCSSA